MSTRLLIIAVVGAACIAAAAAGGFVAVRMDRANRALADVGAPNPPPRTATGGGAMPAVPQADPSSPPPAPVASPPPAATRTTRPAPATETAKEKGKPIHAPKVPGAVAAAPQVVAPPAPDPTAPPPPAPVPAAATMPPPPDPAALTADVPPVDPKPAFEEITVKTDSVIGLALDKAVSSDVAKVEDRVTARVTRDVTVDGRVAIPSSARLEGVVALIQRGGKFKDQARIGVRFTTLYLPDNTKLSIQTDTLFRDGDPPANEATSRVGASAVIGAILGAVVGGKKGAAVGAAAGAGGGAAAVAAGHSNAATIPSGVPMTVRLAAPVTVTVAREQTPSRQDP
jgi:hypothetical protein